MKGTFYGRLSGAAPDIVTDSLIVSFTVSPEYSYAAKQTVQELLRDKGKEVEISVSDKKQKRTLRQNSRLWALINEIAKHNRLTGNDVYKELIRDLKGCTVCVTVKREAKETYCKSWESNGTGWITEVMSENKKECELMCYLGSSKFDKETMQRLMDLAEDEAKALGIDIRSPEEKHRDEIIMMSRKSGRSHE